MTYRNVGQYIYKIAVSSGLSTSPFHYVIKKSNENKYLWIVWRQGPKTTRGNQCSSLQSATASKCFFTQYRAHRGPKKTNKQKKSYIDLINLSALGLSSTEQKTRKHVLWSDESIMSKTDVWLHFPKINKAINFSSTHKDAKASICDGVGSDGIEDLYLWEIQVYLSLVNIQLIMIHLIN